MRQKLVNKTIDDAIECVKEFNSNHPIIKYLEDIKNFPDINNDFIYFGIHFLDDFLSLKGK
jgi:hypothetical protein